MARIDHYEFGRIVVDGREETNDLIVLPGRVVRNWWRQEGHALVLDDLVEVLDELPPHLVVGTGADCRMRPDPDTLRQLEERGVTVEALPTGQAVRRCCPPARGRVLVAGCWPSPSSERAPPDCRRSGLYTNQRMTENLAWYQRLGYEATRRQIRDGYGRVFLRKRLD